MHDRISACVHGAAIRAASSLSPCAIRLTRACTTGVFALLIAAAGCDNPAPPTGIPPAPASPSAAQPRAEDPAQAAKYAKENAPPALTQTPGHPPVGAATGTPPPTAAPSQATPAATQATPAGNTPAAGAAKSGMLKIAAPKDWVEQPPTNAMRFAQYIVPKAAGDTEDAQLVVFVNIGGGADANIARWVSQFTNASGLPLAPDAAKLETFEANGMKVKLVDVTGRYTATAMGPGAPPATPKDNQRMLGAVVETAQGPFYFRLTGPAATVAAQRDAYMTVLKTLSF